MIYPAWGVVTAASFYLGMVAKRRSEGEKEQEELRRVEVEKVKVEEKPAHSFREGAIGDYIERRQEENKYVVYSKHHKCALATHQYIDKKTIEKEQASKLTKIAASNIQTPKVDEPKPQISVAQPVQPIPSPVQDATSQQEQLPLAKHALTNQLYTKVFANYAKELLVSTCDSVQLISGPIFSKDTPYKQNKQVVKSVYVTNPKVTPEGHHITDRYYTLVVCNRGAEHYWAGFSYRRTHFKNYRLLNYLTSLRKIEEMTGLAFQVSGKQLSFVDYGGISKQRLFSDLEPTPEQLPELEKTPKT